MYLCINALKGFCLCLQDSCIHQQKPWPMIERPVSTLCDSCTQSKGQGLQVFQVLEGSELSRYYIFHGKSVCSNLRFSASIGTVKPITFVNVLSNDLCTSSGQPKYLTVLLVDLMSY